MPKPDFKGQQLCCTDLENCGFTGRIDFTAVNGVQALPEIQNSFLFSKNLFYNVLFVKKKKKKSTDLKEHWISLIFYRHFVLS